MNFRRTAPLMDNISTARANYASHDENRKISTGVKSTSQIEGEGAEKGLVDQRVRIVFVNNNIPPIKGET